MTDAEWLTVLGSIGGAAVVAGAALARVRGLEARVKGIEHSNVSRGQRLGGIGERLAVIEYKLFGRRPTSSPEAPGDVTPDRG